MNSVKILTKREREIIYFALSRQLDVMVLNQVGLLEDKEVRKEWYETDDLRTRFKEGK